MESKSVFADRADAGQRLAAALRQRSAAAADAFVCGIPRGGVVVAAQVAQLIERPLRVVIASKVGAPGHPELALGAVGPDGEAVLDAELVRRTGTSTEWLDRALAETRREVHERAMTFPNVLRKGEAADAEVIVVDDGVATGATAAAVSHWLKDVGVARCVLALPVGPADTLTRLRGDYDDVFALLEPANFVAVGQWYRDFNQTTDEEVRRLLA